MPFSANSVLYSKNYPRNINYIPVVIFFVCLDFEKNCYSLTAPCFSLKKPEIRNNEKTSDFRCVSLGHFAIWYLFRIWHFDSDVKLRRELNRSVERYSGFA
jgi:hypothetical protein